MAFPTLQQIMALKQPSPMAQLGNTLVAGFNAYNQADANRQKKEAAESASAKEAQAANFLKQAVAEQDPQKSEAFIAQAFQASPDMVDKFLSMQKLKGEVGGGKEIRKEVRSSIGKKLGALQKQASVLDENYGKLNNLTNEIKKGNRSAVSQALVALVKLGDPGSIVKESEMEAALNAENPVAALQSKGIDTSVIDSIVRKIDPLNPEAINTDELLSTAKAQMAANVPSIQNQYAEQKELANLNLTEKGIGSLFSPRFEERIGGLSRFVESKPENVDEERPVVSSSRYGDVTEADILETMRANNMTRAQVLERLGG